MVARISIFVGDITEQKVDAIVNAANNRMLGGGGVDGAIHRAAGPQLREECSSLGGCKFGEAKITAGHDLDARHVIHTVGPVYGRMNGMDAEILASCYENALLLAKKHGIRSVAFPAISTGAFGYPKSEAALIAIQTVLAFLEKEKLDIEILFVLYSHEDAAYYRTLLKAD